MAGEGVHGADWGSVAAAGLGSDPGPVSVPHSRLSFRQRQRIVNHTVARLWNKLLIEQTKSRPRHSNDNGLVETKNGAVIRKHMGYGHIAAPHAEAIGRFYGEYLNPYVNLHRPCAQAEIQTNENGKQTR